MKKPIHISTSIIVISMILSCNGFLDDPPPGDQFPIDEVFQTASDLESALVGAYDLLQDGNLLGGNVLALSDLMAFNAQGWFEEVSSLQMPTTHWVTERLWSQGYRTINQANAILAALPDVAANDALLLPEDARRIEGEALFIRAVVHFEMVRLYALPYSMEFLDKPGMPLMLEPVLKIESIQFPARATVGEVYGQVISDLQKAQNWLPETNDRGRATQYAATAYLARIAFQKGEYETALLLGGEVLERTDLFGLTSTPQDFFRNEGSAEEIWAVFGSGANDPIVGGLPSVYHDAPTTASITDDLKRNGYNSLLTTCQITKIQDAGLQAVDLRCDPNDLFSKGELLVMEPDSSRCHKYENSWTSGEDDAPNLRLAEFILMQAEALARIAGVNEESVELLNQIRRRSLRVINENGVLVSNSDSLISFRSTDFSDGEMLIEAIIWERRVELAFEGNYLHDLMRLKTNVLNNGKGYAFDANELRLPIPQREIDANPNLEQNPGY